jgi:uncharacterized glyoxalase superfamily protein PhnB
MRRVTRFALVAALALAAPPAILHTASKEPAMHFTRLSPVLIVDAVEPCIAFWVDRLGFTAANQVPGPDGKLVFASVEKDGVEIMYQTRASVVADRPAAAGELTGHSTGLFITVADLAPVERAVAGAPIVKPRHETFYGSVELYVREPGGNVVGFAQFAPAGKQ